LTTTPSISQRSEGANSPNVVTLGSNSPVTINPDINSNRPVVTYTCRGDKKTTGQTPDAFLSIAVLPSDGSFEKMAALFNDEKFGELRSLCEAQQKAKP